VSQDPQNQASATPKEDQVFDMSNATPISNSDSPTGVGSSVKDIWRNVMERSVLAPAESWIDQQNEAGKQIIQNEVNNAHPVRAALARMYFGAQKVTTDLVTGATTPQNITLGIMSGGESVASQGLKAAAGIYYGYRGSQQMLDAHIAGESKSDEVVRRTEGFLQMALSGAAAADTAVGVPAAKLGVKGANPAIGNALRQSIQSNLGLSGELAAKVQAKVIQAQEVKAQAAAQLAGVDKSVKGQVEAVQQVGESTAAQASQDIPVHLKSIISQAAQTVAIEQGKFNTEYTAMEANAKAPVTTADDLKAEIVNSLKDHGLQDAEIAKLQGKIFAALPNAPMTDVRAPTSSEMDASRLAASWSRNGMNPADVRGALLNQGYVPTQVNTAMSIAFPHMAPETQDVSFEMTKRVKTDLYNAAQSATDIETRNGLNDGLAKVDGLRQRYADKQGFGPEFTDLNKRYMQFKRELGSGVMDEFLKARDFADQNTNLLTANHLINQDSGEALRGLLNLAGVDTEPLRVALEDKKAFEALPGQAMTDIQKQAQDLRNQIEAQTGKTVTAIGDKNPIVPGQSDLNLEGKGNLQIRLDALRQLGDNAKKTGIANSGALIQLLYGLSRMAFGSPLGGFSAASGGTRIGIEKTLRSKSFQNWAAQEAGVTPEAMPKFRKMLSNGYPFLEKMSLPTVGAAGLNTATENNQTKQPIVMPAPDTPSATPSAPPTSGTPLRIAGTQ
jgi:hypothetical protein